MAQSDRYNRCDVGSRGLLFAGLLVPAALVAGGLGGLSIRPGRGGAPDSGSGAAPVREQVQPARDEKRRRPDPPRPATLVRVVLRDLGGRPVEGETVRVYSSRGPREVDWWYDPDEPGILETAETDADGLAIVRVPRDGSTFTLLATRRSHEPARFTLSLEPGESCGDVELTLRPLGRVEGRVLLPDGSSAARAEVLVVRARDAAALRRTPGRGSSPWGEIAERARSAYSSGDGAFVIEDVPAGEEILVLAFHEAAAEGRSGPIQLDPTNPAALVEVRLREPGGITVRLFDRDGKPRGASGVEVCWHDPPESGSPLERWSERWVGERGWVLEGLLPGRYVARAFLESTEPAVGEAILREGEATVIELRPPEGREISGRVLWPDGRPLAGCEVSAGESFRHRWPGPVVFPWRGNETRGARATTGADGGFRLVGLSDCPHDLATFTTTGPGGERHRAGGGLQDVPAGVRDAEIVVTPFVPIRVRVVPPRSAALPDPVSVSFGHRRADGGGGCGTYGLSQSPDGFVAYDLEPGRWYVSSLVPGVGWGSSVVDLEPGRPGEVEVRLAPVLEIRGRVRDPEGKPVPNAVVTVGDPWLVPERQAWNVSIADGRFLVENCPPGENAISVEAEGYPRLETRVVLDGSWVELRLPLGGRIQPRVLEVCRGEAPYVCVRTAGDRRPVTAWYAGDGAPTGAGLPPLLPGRYEARLAMGLAEGPQVEVEVRAGEIAEVVLAPPTPSPGGR